MKGIRVLCLAFAVAGFSALAQNAPQAPELEHLVRQADELLTETNLTRANQFLIRPTVVTQIQTAGGWGGGFYTRLIVQPAQASRIPEYAVGKLVNDFRMHAILLYDMWNRPRGPVQPPLISFNPGAFVNQFMATDYAYLNALAATSYYIEALRRSYLIRGADPCYNPQLLRQRMTKLAALHWMLRDTMYRIRTLTVLGSVPQRRYPIEVALRNYVINVNIDVAQPFVPVPFYYENRMWNVDGFRPSDADMRAPMQSSYDTRFWNQYYQQRDQVFMNAPQSQRPSNQGGQGPGYPQVRDPLAQPGVGVPGQQPGGVPGYPDNRDVVPQNDYDYNR